MNKRTLLLCILCMGLNLSAQDIIGTRIANPADGKILTMEETILSRDLSPKNLWCSWHSNEQIMMHKDGKWSLYNVSDGSTSEYTSGEERAALPEGAENKTPGTNGLVAFTSGQSLFIADERGNVIPVAESENKQITYGQSVSRNEFGISGGIFWSPDCKRLAFYRKDETLVSTFPLLDITTRTGSLKEIKYPMAGMESENVQVGVYDLASNRTVYIKADDFGYDQYLTNVSWSDDGRLIFIQVLDRTQKHMRLNMYCASTGNFIRTLVSEDDERYVEPSHPLWQLKGSENLFIWSINTRDGYRNLYLIDTEGGVKRLTEVEADVEYVANNGRNIWYTSAEVSPIENHLFSVSLALPRKGAEKVTDVKVSDAKRLTFEEGWHTIAMSPDCSMYIDSYSSLTVPRVTSVHSSDGKAITTLLEAEDPTSEYAYSEISIGTVKSADGLYDNYFRLIKPKDFDPNKKYPAIVYVYGGPHSQMVKNTFMAELRRWEMYMAQRGYVVYVQDNRGTSNRGEEFEKAIHKQCGQAEMADQMVGVRMLMDLPYVDNERIGVHGWSYGGFMTISLMTNYPDVFKVGVAGGPVIDWKWYEVMYGERYMETPQSNPEGFEKTSLINKAKDLKGKLLICQGAIDPVVVWEHSLSFVRECVKNNVQVDYFPYPCAEHNVMGKDRVHLMDKVSIYFEDYL